MKRAAKAIFHAVSLALMFPAAACCGFGRFATAFSFFAQWVSLVPGLPGSYLRIAYYRLTLRKCSLNSRISFGTYLNRSTATVGEGVYIGSWCVLGNCQVGDRTQIADHVQVPSGRRQHARDDENRIQGPDSASFGAVTIGEDCWIGTSAIVMEDVGPRSTVGAGSVVTKPVAADTVVAGNPARVIQAISQTGP
jgi:acetyltransferase-like isoleucine patch superfamily enzyme